MSKLHIPYHHAFVMVPSIYIEPKTAEFFRMERNKKFMKQEDIIISGTAVLALILTLAIPAQQSTNETYFSNGLMSAHIKDQPINALPKKVVDCNAKCFCHAQLQKLYILIKQYTATNQALGIQEIKSLNEIVMHYGSYYLSVSQWKETVLLVGITNASSAKVAVNKS